MFGRHDGETEEEYRARIGPLINDGPRDAAHARRPRTAGSPRRRPASPPSNRQQLDPAFDKVYADVLDYTNKAITDGQLSPYERNVAGWLDYAGGLGGMLNDAKGRSARSSSPDQVEAMWHRASSGASTSASARRGNSSSLHRPRGRTTSHSQTRRAPTTRLSSPV